MLYGFGLGARGYKLGGYTGGGGDIPALGAPTGRVWVTQEFSSDINVRDSMTKSILSFEGRSQHSTHRHTTNSHLTGHKAFKPALKNTTDIIHYLCDCLQASDQRHLPC